MARTVAATVPRGPAVPYIPPLTFHAPMSRSRAIALRTSGDIGVLPPARSHGHAIREVYTRRSLATDTAPRHMTRAGHVHTEGRVTTAQAEEEPGLRHAGIDDGITERIIDLVDAVHPAEVHDDLAVGGREAVAVTPVAPARDRVERKPAPAG